MNFNISIKIASFLVILAGCQSTQTTSLDQLATNLSNSFPGIWQLLTAIANFMGMLFIFRGVYQLKLYGDLRTMMSTQTNLKSTMMLFLAGTALLFSKSTYQVIFMSLFAQPNPSPLTYSSSDGSALSLSSAAILQLVQIIGYISFLRGWVFLTQASGQGGHVTTGKALTHIFGGLLAVNIQATRDVLQATLGL